MGYQPEQFCQSILAIPTSTVAYEFTRRIYVELGLDISCLASKFTAYAKAFISVSTAMSVYGEGFEEVKTGFKGAKKNKLEETKA